MSRAAVLIPAAGAGRRMGTVEKAFLEIDGEPVLLRAIRPFLEDPRVEWIIVALAAGHAHEPPDWLTGVDPRVRVVEGGAERTDSVRRALEVVPEADVIVVHDAARPLVTVGLIARTLDAAASGLAVTAALPVTDTIHRVDADGSIVETPDRATLWRAQTPQAFPAAILRAAHSKALERGFTATDDAALVAGSGARVHIVEGDPSNIKITVQSDLELAKSILERRRR